MSQNSLLRTKCTVSKVCSKDWVKFIKFLSQLKKAELRFQLYFVLVKLLRSTISSWPLPLYNMVLSISIRIGDSLGPGKGSKPSPCDFDHYGASLMMEGE